MTAPDISVITPCLNQGPYIRDAIESVLKQDYPSFEHIVVDGGSSDGTLQALSHFPHLHVISEPDKGMYDAINKGLRLAGGRFIGLLNADDLYAAGAFRCVIETFASQTDMLAISGAADTFSGCFDEGHIVVKNSPVTGQDFWRRMVDTPVTNAWFFKPEVFARIGNFNLDYRYIADREFFIRLALSGLHPYPVQQTLYHYRQHPSSATISAEDSRTMKRGLQRIIVLSEDLQMLEGFLARGDLPLEARYAIRRSHSERAYRLAATAFYHHLFRQSTRACWLGLRHDALWPIVVFSMAARRVSKEFSVTV